MLAGLPRYSHLIPVEIGDVIKQSCGCNQVATFRRRRFRTLDALQLAVALDLSRRGMTEYFVCADTRLCETAEEEGLVIVNPVQP